MQKSVALVLILAACSSSPSGEGDDTGSAGDRADGQISSIAAGGAGSMGTSGGMHDPSVSAAGGGSSASGAGGGRTGGPGGGGQAGGALAKLDAGGAETVVPTGLGSTSSMRLISRNTPAYASSKSGNADPKAANDGDPLVTWSPQGMPAWLAYDLSEVPADRRQDNLAVWNDVRPGYIYEPLTAFVAVPVNYTIETNTAPGGSAPPSSGWNQVVAVSGNDRGTMQHRFKLMGANWVRMTVSQTSDPAGGLFLDLDIFSTPAGATDSWMMMGDSITFACTTYAYSDLPALVQKVAPARYPAITDAAIAGTSAMTAVGVIDDTIKNFPGPFIALAYGTNDLADEFPANMETLVKKVILSGKVPVVPHMPWSDQRLDRGPLINASIDALYAKYPEILRGPDLWAFFKSHPELISNDHLHPNDAGAEELRKQWAAVMAAVP